jgi:hypothetical protein
MRTAVTTSTKACLASFEVSYLIAKNKKPHTIGETLLLPAAMRMCETMHQGRVHILSTAFREVHRE